MKIINISGPINSGKTTVSKLLTEKLPYCFFIEVDNLLSDEEQKKMNLKLEEGWAERLKRLDEIIIKEKKNRCYENIIFAYPMTDRTYHRWKLWEDKNTKFINVTLSPDIEICLKNRGNRELTEWEKQRIKQMYAQNYNAPQCADIVIDNGKQTPEETVTEIISFIKGKEIDENI
ncbi:MAG: adenylyl-sulfate kinase [Alphaproteobacteria bacterium]|nr:adenylyl-sulfate kinase [Alphaproteobacteria bacterium]